MSMFVAFCENPSCGAIFPAPNLIGGDGSATIQMTNSRYGPCPNCGGFGRIPDGIYGYANHVVEFLRGPQESLAALRKVQALLADRRTRSQSRDEVLSQVRNVAPRVASAMEKVPSIAVTQQWIQVLIALVTLAILIQTTYFKKSDKELEKLFIEHLLQENKQLKQQTLSATNGQTYRRPSEKVPRNATCPCGSGKKHKRCCGATGGSPSNQPDTAR